ncbi:hypothetical protein [Microbacterium abyssi]|uniref:hypothetical protein n=1 Tax=Microbacterium abyssi TaxID=2782166 RepID=UPI0018898715|nr:hypothetical protein [Microbacterium sp. A18JL241]
MPAEDASSELRALRAKAYGRDGGLSAEELARLHELEGPGTADEPAEEERPRLPSVAQPLSSAAAPQPPLNDPQEAGPAPSASTHDPTAELLSRVAPRAEGETKRVERAERVETASSPEQPRRRWPVILGTAAALLAIGLGVGWGIWGWDSHQFALDAAHGEERAELEASGAYDPGTVVPIAEQHGVVVWRADRSEGEELCVIVTGAEHSQDGCIAYEQVEKSNWPNASATVPEGQEEAGHQLVAGLIPTPSGELVPFIQVWGGQEQFDWESQYSESELAQAREIEAAGYLPESLSIIGYDGDTAIWSTWESGQFCVLAPADDGLAEMCADDPTQDITLVLRVDGVPTDYIVRQAEMRGPQLTIVRHPVVSEFSVDDPMFDDLVIDDKTGDVVQ